MDLTNARDIFSILGIVFGSGLLMLAVRAATSVATIQVLRDTVTAYKEAKVIADQEKAAFVQHVAQLKDELTAAVTARGAAEAETKAVRAETNEVVSALTKKVLELERIIGHLKDQVADLKAQLGRKDA